MKIAFPLSIAALLTIVSESRATVAVAEPMHEYNQLWYDKPVPKCDEALPVGNGRIGAIIFGGTKVERLLLNEGTLWAGGPYDPVNKHLSSPPP